VSIDETIYDKIQTIIGNLDGNLNILEEEIDINIQLEYFELSKELKKNQLYLNKLQAIEVLKSANNKNTELKKAILSLSILNDVEALRALEQFLKQSNGEIRKWALIACQENKMLIESSLLDQNQIFITTGLGGKNGKLRYCLAIPVSNKKELSYAEQNIITEEFSEVISQFSSTIEEMYFSDKNYLFGLVLVPLKIPIKRLFATAIAHCNEYGNFLNTDYLITNVKIPLEEEIVSYFFK